MDKTPDDYHISFFKPTTPQATANRNMVVVLVLIWFFAIFGFQFLLWIFEKPTPEPAYQTFTEVWPKVSDGTSSNTELQEFGQSTLSVLGKIMLSEEEKSILSNALSWTLLELAAEEGVDTDISSADLGLLTDAGELSLIKQISAWPRLVETAAHHQEPHRITFYLYDLASEFNAQWNRGQEDPSLRFIRPDAPDLTAARLAMVMAVRVVISAGLGILGVAPMEEM